MTLPFIKKAFANNLLLNSLFGFKIKDRTTFYFRTKKTKRFFSKLSKRHKVPGQNTGTITVSSFWLKRPSFPTQV